MNMSQLSLLEVQFPIAPLSLESYIERLPYTGKPLSSLGKWWGSKPLVLTRAIILATVFPASDDSERWPDDLEIFLKCMCLDDAGMWRRKTESLPAEICWPLATNQEREELFADDASWKKRGVDRNLKETIEKRVFYTLGHTVQREYCCRVEEIDGPAPESWREINAYLQTTATTLAELVQQLARRRYGSRLTVGDAFSGLGSIPFEAAEMGCDVYASDLNPVACLLTWGALNIVGGSDEFRDKIHAEQKRVYDEVDTWTCQHGLENSEEGWRAEAYLYCVEMAVPEWDGWRIPICPRWVIAPKTKTWVELVPIETEKRFGFRVVDGGVGWSHAEQGTKQGQDVVCPPSLWEIFRRDGRHQNSPRTIPYSQLVENAGGLRQWEKRDYIPRPDDLLQERLYCIRWRKPDYEDERGRTRRGELVFREPRTRDLEMETRVLAMLEEVFDDWQSAGWIPGWRIEPGAKTFEPIRTRGWTHWHHLFNPRQLLMAGEYSRRTANCEAEVRAALILSLGRLVEANARLTRWELTKSGGVGGCVSVYYNQALNTLLAYVSRAWAHLNYQAMVEHRSFPTNHSKTVCVTDARETEAVCRLWITDPPYADAVNYEELSEFFLAWYVPHLKAAFPEWYTDSMRSKAVKGNDAPFRVAMADCYRRLAKKMPDDGMQVLMFTHKSTDVWEDLALIMWAAGLQVKQVWSIATETPGAGIRSGNYVQATYNMVLRKRTGSKMGFVDFITPQVNKRVQEVITRMRQSQIEGRMARCGYTDTDYLLAAQAAAAEVVTGYATIDGVDLEAELRTPNNQRGRSALRTLMENAKRTATDFLVPPAMERAIRKHGAGDSYQFWRNFVSEEKFLLKGLELEQLGMFKISAFQDLGRAYGLADYESLMGAVRANDTRTSLPEELPRPDSVRFADISPAERNLWKNSPTRHVYHALKLLREGANMDRAVKHLVDSTDFWNLRTSRLAVILAYLREITADNEHWGDYQKHLSSLAIGVENWRA
jgi:adenine-specific DNA methylase